MWRAPNSFSFFQDRAYLYYLGDMPRYDAYLLLSHAITLHSDDPCVSVKCAIMRITRVNVTYVSRVKSSRPRTSSRIVHSNIALLPTYYFYGYVGRCVKRTYVKFQLDLMSNLILI